MAVLVLGIGGAGLVADHAERLFVEGYVSKCRLGRPTLACCQTAVPLKAAGETESALRVAVVGAGLGGLALAIGLLAAGVDVLIYEKARRVRDASQGTISIWPNGMKALRAVHPEIPAELSRAGCSPVSSAVLIGRKEDGRAGPNSSFTDATGMFAAFPQRFGMGAMFAAWTDIQRVLAARVPEDRIRCGKELVGIEEHDAGVRLRFADGTEATASVLVGADGTFSATRRILQSAERLPESSKVRFFGQTNWASIVEGYHSPLLGEDRAEGRLAMLNVAGQPPLAAAFVSLGNGRMFWQVRVTDDQGALRTTDETGCLGAPGAKQKVLELARGVPELSAAVEATSEARIYERSIYDLHPPLPRFVAGRVVLLGDAAHAPHTLPGQGANFAFEDAAELAHVLGRLPADGAGLEAALEAYEAARLERCHSMQSWAAEAGAAQKDGVASRATGPERSVGPEERARRTAFLYGWRPPGCPAAGTAVAADGKGG